ncbi:GNAT family N-acetyltransferase [Psychromonas sp. KJ10-10]|uniref:GNAT family N-acetyltransferase n=1 Tax=Psychromonas sp. KJ10-10 TaxID=3391823 RepID=UPI0039B49A68
MNIQYLRDADVTDALDQKIRDLLSSCFVQNQDAEIFKRQRCYYEMPAHRYLLWQEDRLIAHIAVHDKNILINDIEHSICGIAEVCVDAQFRKQGLVKAILNKVHQDRKANGDAYAVLFGDTEVYASSGYSLVNNLKALNHSKEWAVTGHTLVHALTKSWPTSSVKLIGIPF